ncbi:MAG TPA: hypothetical protein EYP68_03230, partial [Candidatus Korarchaeota archaeon]|nr:hypothetical protein [Candidatus Korarchaeota archaeon]
MKVVLVTGRTVDQGVEAEAGKLREEYAKKVAVVELDPEDLSSLGISEGSPVLVKTSHGEVVLKAVKAKGRHPGIAFSPLSPWINVVIDSETDGSGMPTFKGVEAEILQTDEDVLTIGELLERYYEQKVDFSELICKEVTREGSSEERLVKDVICPFCGCLCDDIEILVRNGVIAQVKNACAIGS